MDMMEEVVQYRLLMKSLDIIEFSGEPLVIQWQGCDLKVTYKGKDTILYSADRFPSRLLEVVANT